MTEPTASVSPVVAAARSQTVQRIGIGAAGAAVGAGATAIALPNMQGVVDKFVADVGPAGLLAILAAGALSVVLWRRGEKDDAFRGALTDAAVAGAVASTNTANAVASSAAATKEMRDTLAKAVERVEALEDRVGDEARQVNEVLRALVERVDSLARVRQIEGRAHGDR